MRLPLQTFARLILQAFIKPTKKPAGHPKNMAWYNHGRYQNLIKLSNQKPNILKTLKHLKLYVPTEKTGEKLWVELC